MEAIGRHIIVEFYDCLCTQFNDTDFLEEVFVAAAKAMNATVLSSNFHPFSPIGTSGVVIIKESHLTVHTWPEHQYAAIDIFTCGVLDIDNGLQYLEDKLLPQNKVQQEIKRGIIVGSSDKRHF